MSVDVDGLETDVDTKGDVVEDMVYWEKSAVVPFAELEPSSYCRKSKKYVGPAVATMAASVCCWLDNGGEV